MRTRDLKRLSADELVRRIEELERRVDELERERRPPAKKTTPKVEK